MDGSDAPPGAVQSIPPKAFADPALANEELIRSARISRFRIFGQRSRIADFPACGLFNLSFLYREGLSLHKSLLSLIRIPPLIYYYT